MNLVDYSSSSSEDELEVISKNEKEKKEETNINPNLYSKRKLEYDNEEKKKKPKRPPLPGDILSLYGDDSYIIDKSKPSRAPIDKPIEGNWPTYIYIIVNFSEEMLKNINEINLKLKEINSKIHGFDYYKDEIHISLSRTIFLKYFQHDRFCKLFFENLSGISKFYLSFDSFKSYVNDDKTRSFFSLNVGTGYDKLFNIMKKIDEIVVSFHQKPFYIPPQYHASIAWAEDKTIINEDIINQFKDQYLNKISNNIFIVKEINLKIGYKLKTLYLK